MFKSSFSWLSQYALSTVFGLFGCSLLNAQPVILEEGDPIGRHYGPLITYGFPDEPIIEGYISSQPEVIDINGDGLDEVVFSLMGPEAQWNPDVDPATLRILSRSDEGLLHDITASMIQDPGPLTPGGSRQIMPADFNGDGRLDLFLDNPGLETDMNSDLFAGGLNQVLLSDDDGKLEDVTETHLPQLTSFSHGSSVADFDGDGDMDIFVSNFVATELADSRTSYLMFNDGQGHFEVVADLSLPGVPKIVGRNGRFPEDKTYWSDWSAAVDAEGDGDMDIYLGLTHVNPICPTFPICVEYFDYVIFLNDGSGHFSEGAPDAIQAFGQNDATFDHVLVHDINGDGLDDLLLAASLAELDFPFKQYLGNLIIQILISNGDGTFRDESAARYPQSDDSDSVVSDSFQLHDLDGDGHMDLFSNSSFDDNDIRINDGEGNFRRLDDDWARNFGVVLDVDGDGGTDFFDWHEGRYTIAKMNLPYGAVLDGTEDDDRLIGGAHDNVYRGLAGNDVLDGGLGDDDLDGGTGDDELIGGKGDDWLKPGPGSNTVDGGPGRDLVEYALAIDDVEILPGETSFISTGNNSVNDEVKNTEYAVFTDAATPLPTNQQSAITSLNGVAGLWYDPALDGEGFNIITAPSGTVIFFYGYTAAGQRLWLISETLPADFAFEQVLDLQMFQAQGGTFDQPAPSAQALSDWGRLKGLFDSCGTGRLALNGNDGVKTTYQIKLAGITDADCTTQVLSAPSGLAGLWYDPLLDGEGYNLIITATSTVFFFYGYDANGQRLWLISETMADAPLVGENVKLKMFSASGGTFDEPAPSAESLSDWGDLDITFNSCGDAIANLTGTDGDKTSNLTKLAGIENATCP